MIQELILQNSWSVQVLLSGMYVILYYVFGAPVTIAVFCVHLSFPIVFKYCATIRCKTVFLNLVQTSSNLDQPSVHGVKGGRNITIRHESNVEDSTVDIAVWHILSASSYKKQEYAIEQATSAEEIDAIFDAELKNTECPIFLYVHGISESRGLDHRVVMYNLLQNQDAHVITFDYRGFADSTYLVPTKKGMVEDTLMVYAWIRKMCGNNRPVFVWGHSMGSAIAAKMLSNLEEYSVKYLEYEKPLPPPAGFILEGCFDNMAALSLEFPIAYLFRGMPHYKMIVPKVLEQEPDVRLMPGKYANRLRHLPVLQLHAENDEIIPYKFGARLNAALKETRTESDPPVTFASFKKGGHMWLCNDEKLPLLIEEFIAKHK